MLHEDYLRLFSRHELPLAPAYESQYRKIKYESLEAKQTTVTEFYKSYGWKSKFNGRINDDHLGIELLFLTILIEKYLVLDDKACQVEMREEIRRFIGQHLLTWIPEWNEKMQTNSNTMCYKGIGTLIIASIEDIYEILGQR
jgi:TorA maturation chaperone TorD